MFPRALAAKILIYGGNERERVFLSCISDFLAFSAGSFDSSAEYPPPVWRQSQVKRIRAATAAAAAFIANTYCALYALAICRMNLYDFSRYVNAIPIHCYGGRIVRRVCSSDYKVHNPFMVYLACAHFYVIRGDGAVGARPRDKEHHRRPPSPLRRLSATSSLEFHRAATF